MPKPSTRLIKYNDHDDDIDDDNIDDDIDDDDDDEDFSDVNEKDDKMI